MGDTRKTPRDAAPPPPSGGGIDWDAQPLSLTTREAATLLGKSPGNVRARASKGDFGATMTGPDGLPRYDRERVRLVGERMAARQAQAQAMMPATFSDVALCKAWLEEARATMRQAKEEAKELRDLLHEREETTRETLSHLDMLHEQHMAHMKEALERERAQWERTIATQDREIERLKAQIEGRN